MDFQKVRYFALLFIISLALDTRGTFNLENLASAWAGVGVGSISKGTTRPCAIYCSHKASRLKISTSSHIRMLSSVAG
jgi:hypothetical protein